MKSLLLIYIIMSGIYIKGYSQIKAPIRFQGIARNEQGVLLADKQMNVRISLLKDSNEKRPIYQEIKSVKTNVLGMFFVELGQAEMGKVTTGTVFEAIEWDDSVQFIQVEIDPNNQLQFIQLGIQTISAVPYAFYAGIVQANHIKGVLTIEKGGTGVNNLKDLRAQLLIDKTNNTPDSLKPVSKAVTILINEKLNKIDTQILSNRINLKLNKQDTLSLSNRIISLSTLIPAASSYACLYDTSRQSAVANTATAINWSFSVVSKTITITQNSAGSPTRINNKEAGLYKIGYHLQCIKLDAGTEELSVWIRRNSAAYANTLSVYTILGAGIKNQVYGSHVVEMGENDYVEIIFSTRSTNVFLSSSPIQTNPSRPATPAVYMTMERWQ